jgi:membrane protein DedA with SNARE-associated domain
VLDPQHWIDLLGTLYGHYGYPLVFLGALAENTTLLGLLLPGNSLALLGAFYAQQGTLSLGWVILLAWLGTVLGYHADYLLGRFVLERVALRWSATPLGRRARLAGRLRLARRMLARHGVKAILLSHLVGHIRSFVALSAGATRMRYRTFLAAELVAALLWSTAFCLLGYFVGGERARLEALLTRSGWALLLGVVVLVVLWRLFGERLRVWWRARRTPTGRLTAPLLRRRVSTLDTQQVRVVRARVMRAESRRR